MLILISRVGLVLLGLVGMGRLALGLLNIPYSDDEMAFIERYNALVSAIYVAYLVGIPAIIIGLLLARQKLRRRWGPVVWRAFIWSLLAAAAWCVGTMFNTPVGSFIDVALVSVGIFLMLFPALAVIFIASSGAWKTPPEDLAEVFT